MPSSKDVMCKLVMNVNKAYTLESSYKLFKSNRDYYWLLGSWLVLLTWAYWQSAYTLLIPPLVVTLIILLPVERLINNTTRIIINNDSLSIHRGEAVLWSTLLENITSIELERKGFFQLGARKALLIRNNKKDSFYLALDGLRFKNFEDTELITELKSIVDKSHHPTSDQNTQGPVSQAH